MFLYLGRPVPKGYKIPDRLLRHLYVQRLVLSNASTSLLLMGMLVAATLGVASLVFYEYVQKPRVVLVANVFATQIRAIDAAATALPPAERERFLLSLDSMSQGGISLDDPADWTLAMPELTLVQSFFKQLGLRLSDQKIAFSVEPSPQVWVELLYPGRETRWLRMPLQRYLKLPSGVVLAAFFTLAGLVIGSTYWLLIVSRKRLKPLAIAIDSLGRLDDVATDWAEKSFIKDDVSKTLLSKFRDMSQRLAQAETDRTLMLAGLSHDLRSMLTRMRLGIAILDVDEARPQTLILHINEMNRLISQFLDFARPPEPTEEVAIDLSEVVSAVVAAFESEGATIDYVLRTLPKTNLEPVAVRRLLTNLIDNALRHGGVGVEVTTVLEKGFILLQILDRGPGVSLEELKNLSLPFFRTNSARARCAGSGLGLAIARRIAESCGGFLRVTLRDGGGICVEASFPLCTAPVVGPQQDTNAIAW